MPIGAAIGATVVSAGASLAGTAIASHNQSKAASNALQYQQQIRSDVQPYLTAGKNALGMIDNPNALAANYTSSPGYKWALGQGENAVLQNKAMNGLLRSGGAMKALDTYATGAASQDFNNWWTQQYDIAKLGSDAEGTAAGVANNSGNIQLNNAAQQGNAAISTGNQIGKLSGSLASLFGSNNQGASSYGTPGTGPGVGFGSGADQISADPGASNYFPF